MKTWIKNPHLFEVWLNYFLKIKDPTDAPVLALHEYKIAYIPIPKAANSSIRTALQPYLKINAEHKGGIHDLTRDLLVPSSKFFSEISDDWFVFTVVRNPATRAQSAWRNKLVESKKIFMPLRKMGITDRLSFEDFLQVCNDWPAWALNDHFMAQSKLLSRAISNKKLNVFKVETLAEDWVNVQREFAERGIPDLADLNILNKSLNKPKGLREREIQLLRNLYGKDFQVFDYPIPETNV